MTLRWSSRRAEVGPLFQWQRHLAPAAGQCCRPASGFRPSFFPFVVHLNPHQTTFYWDLLLDFPFQGGGCCCKSLLSECWSVLGKAASLVVVVMHPGAGCVCRRNGHASSLALPGLVSLPYDSLLKDWIGESARHYAFHYYFNALLSICASACNILVLRKWEPS